MAKPTTRHKLLEAQGAFQKKKEVERISTGNIGWDYLLRGGIPKGRAIELAGPEGCNKTMTALLFHAAMERAGYVGTYHDAEGAVDEDYIARSGIDPLKTVPVPVESGENLIHYLLQQVHLYEREEESDAICTLDSVPAIAARAQVNRITDRVSGEEATTAMDSKAAPFWSLQYPILSQVMRQGNITLLFINQFRSTMDQWRPIGTPGGNTLPYLYSLRFWARYTGKPTKFAQESGIEELQQTSRVEWVVEKSRFARKGDSIEFDYGEFGPDPYSAMIQVALKLDLVEQVSNSHYYWKENFASKLGIERKICNGRKNLYYHLRDNPDQYQAAYVQLLADIECLRKPKRKELSANGNDAGNDRDDSNSAP